MRTDTRPAVCYSCGADVEDGPRFGAEATCDACRRSGRGLVSACAWCADHAQRLADAALAGRQVTVYFDENGGEYIGYFVAVGWSTLRFDCDEPRCIHINGVSVMMDENINNISVDGEDMTMDESWEIER